ncbi:MAG: alpha/beta fold hydrolase [Candidatus Dormibacteria bacterium]
MNASKLGLTIGIGAGALATAGYASAVGLARRQPSEVGGDEEIEIIVDRWLEDLGVDGFHHYVETGVGRIHVLEVGRGQSTLVLLHGLGASIGHYAALAARLSLDFRVIGIDRPGSGLSDPIRFQGHPRPAWNHAVNSVADHLGLGSFDLVGHSLGGLAAGGFAVDHGDRVRRLVLLSPVGMSSRRPIVWSVSLFPGVTDLLGAAGRRAMARQSRNPDKEAVEVGADPGRIGPDMARYRYLVGRRFSRGADLDTVPRLMRPCGFRPESLLLPGLDALAERTLVVWGDRDDQVALGPARAELLAHRSITLRVLEGAGHLFPLEDPALTAALISHWCLQDGA